MAKGRTGEFKTSAQERWFYWIFFLGQNILWGFAKYTNVLLTDLGIAATLASTILLFPKIWDAINDTLFGVLIDKMKFKNGQKFLPWARIGTAAVGIIVIAMFGIPASTTQTVKIVWFLIAYIFFDAAYTLLDAPMFALTTVMTDNIQERTSIIAGNKLWSMVGGMLPVVLVPLVREPLGKVFGNNGWFGASIVFIVVSIAMMVPILIKGKERFSSPISDKKDSVSFKEMFGYLKSNKYLFIAILFMFITGITSVENALSIYIARHCFGSEKMGTILALIVAVPVIIMSAVIPAMARKWDKFNVLVGGLLFSAVMGVVAYFVGYTKLLPSMVIIGLKCCGMAFNTVISYMLIADTVEYGTYKSGTRAAGITFSFQTFIAKVNAAIVGSLALAIMGFAGFVEGEGVAQTEAVSNAIWAEFTLLPALGYVVGIIVLVLFYKLRDRYVQTMAAYNNGEISKEVAETELLEKFGPAAEVIAE